MLTRCYLLAYGFCLLLLLGGDFLAFLLRRATVLFTAALLLAPCFLTR